MTDVPFYPYCKPFLPCAEKLLPYLGEIDNNRYYSNFGPLVQKLQDRLASITNSQILSMSSGMAALEIAIMAMNLPHKSKVLVPSWTFIATPHAAYRMGYDLIFLDCSKENWALDPQSCIEFIQNSNEQISLVIPVAPFGLPLDIKAWENVEKTTGARVLIDGAAMRIQDITSSRSVPVMVSLHATKYLPAAEGGILISDDTDFLARCKAIANFGIDHDAIKHLGGNYKMSEYHAAIAHCSLDEKTEIEQDWARVYKRYFDQLSHISNISIAPVTNISRPNSTMIITCDNIDENVMKAAGIGTRRWWRNGCHNSEYYQNLYGLNDTSFPNTSKLAKTSIGLPCYRTLQDKNIDMICEKLEVIYG